MLTEADRWTIDAAAAFHRLMFARQRQNHAAEAQARAKLHGMGIDVAVTSPPAQPSDQRPSTRGRRP